MPKPELVRVRMADGSVVNHTRAWAERHDLEVLDRPAVVAGREVQPKPKVSVDEAASNKSGGGKTASSTKKESDK